MKFYLFFILILLSSVSFAKTVAIQCTGFHLSAEDGRWKDTFSLREGTASTHHDETLNFSDSPMCHRRIMFQLMTAFAFSPQYQSEEQERVYKPMSFVFRRHFMCNELFIHPNNAWGANEIIVYNFRIATLRNRVLESLDHCDMDIIRRTFEALNFDFRDRRFNQTQEVEVDSTITQ